MNLRAIYWVVIPLTLSTAAAVLAQPADVTGRVTGSVTGARFVHESRSLRMLVGDNALDGHAAGGSDWLGYRVPKVAGSGLQCCFRRDRGAGCNLASGSGGHYGSHHSRAREIQPGQHLLIFLPPAAAQGRHRVRAYDSACPVDGDGLRIRWLGDVSVHDSLAVLGPWARGPGQDRSALRAISLHDGGEATAMLAAIVHETANGGDLRAAAAFWLAAHRGTDGYHVLRDLLAAVDRPSLRQELVAALAQSEVPEALDQLIDLARHDRSPKVRGEGLFWLAQTASNRVPKVLMEAAERDPEIGVKKKAVFAISQLPIERGVPLLINVAEQHASAAVRERAVFWLGQSEDPRALEFIVSLLMAPAS